MADASPPATGRPDPQEWIERLTAPLASLQGGAERLGEISRLEPPKAAADDTLKLLVRDAAGNPWAVALCSSSVAPLHVARAMERAEEARTALGADLGRVILEPLEVGDLEGRSYALLPYCQPLRKDRVGGWLQRRRLRRPILDWLLSASCATRVTPTPEETARDFGERLSHVASFDRFGGGVRSSAEEALELLERGKWAPRYVLAHNDLWKGNFLLPAGGGFAVIDWGGARIRGHAFFDLVRVAESFGLSPAALRAQVRTHCDALACDAAGARAYLLSALGDIGLHLEHFPVDRYVAMAESCIERLEAAQ